jgi:hypothetical protein
MHQKPTVEALTVPWQADCGFGRFLIWAPFALAGPPAAEILSPSGPFSFGALLAFASLLMTTLQRGTPSSEEVRKVDVQVALHTPYAGGMQ